MMTKNATATKNTTDNNSSIVSVGDTYRLYGSAVSTHDSLPLGTYKVQFSELSGFSLLKISDLGQDGETIYGKHHKRVQRTISTYTDANRSLGVLLSGDKGMGKSLMVRMLAEQARIELGLPTIIVDANAPGIASFIDEIGEAFIIFDEFEKVFPSNTFSDEKENQQNQFLSLFDGMSEVKRAYIVTVNDVDRLSPYFVNRPGRFHYHLRFDYPSSDEVAKYLSDNAPSADEETIEKVINFSATTSINYDHLRAISFEIERGEMFDEIISELNIKRDRELLSYKVTFELEDSTTVSDVVSMNLSGSDSREAMFYFKVSAQERWFCTIDMNKTSTHGDVIIVPKEAVTIESEGESGRRPRSRSRSQGQDESSFVSIKSCSLKVQKNDKLSFVF